MPSLHAFLHEYHIWFSVGVNAPADDGDPTPRTMRAYRRQGTPTTLLIDAKGYLRRQVFGPRDDRRRGAGLQTLLLEAKAAESAALLPASAEGSPGCDEAACSTGRATRAG